MESEVYFFWSNWGEVCFFQKSSVISEDVYRIIKDVFIEDQKKVLHHYHRCCERNCSSLGADVKQSVSSKKDKFQHKRLFEANVQLLSKDRFDMACACWRWGYVLLHLQEIQMYESAKQVQRFQQEAFCKIQNDCNQRTRTVAETFGGNIMRDDEPSFCFPKGTGWATESERLRSFQSILFNLLAS